MKTIETISRVTYLKNKKIKIVHYYLQRIFTTCFKEFENIFIIEDIFVQWHNILLDENSANIL